MEAVGDVQDERLQAHLAEGEKAKAKVHQHWMVLAKPLARALAGTVVWFWLAASVPMGNLMTALFIGMLALWVWFGWEAFERKHNWIAVTDKRIFKYEGYFVRTWPMMRISKVTDVTYHRSIPGRIFGYGLIIIESAGQDQALRELNYIPFPTGTDALKAALFGEEPKTRRTDDGPRWRPRLRRNLPPQDGDDDGWDGPDGGGDGPRDGDDSGGNAGGLLDDGASPVREGDPRRTGRFTIEDPDVPSAGDWRAHPRPSGSARVLGRRGDGIPTEGESIYASPDRRPRTSRTADTGPIPISTRRSEQ